MITVISIVLAIIVFNVVAVIVLKRRKEPEGNTSGTGKPAGDPTGTVAEKPDGNTSGTGAGNGAGACVVELTGKTNDVLYQQVSFSDDVGGRYVSAYYCSDVAGGEYTLQTNGDLNVKLKLKCGKGQLKRENLTLSIDDHKPVIPTKMYDGRLYQTSVIEFDKETAEDVVLYFENVFDVLGRQFERANKNASWSVDLKYMGKDLFACDMYAMKGDGGWVAR